MLGAGWWGFLETKGLCYQKKDGTLPGATDVRHNEPEEGARRGRSQLCVSAQPSLAIVRGLGRCRRLGVRKGSLGVLTVPENPVLMAGVLHSASVF